MKNGLAVLALVLGLLIALLVGAVWIVPMAFTSFATRSMDLLEAADEELRARSTRLEALPDTLFPAGSFERQTVYRDHVITVSFLGVPGEEPLDAEQIAGLTSDLHVYFSGFAEVLRTFSMPGSGSASEAGDFDTRAQLSLEYAEPDGDWRGECTLIVGTRPDVVSITVIEYRVAD